MTSNYISVQNQGDERFTQILSGHIGDEILIFTNFLGINTPQIPIRGQLQFVGRDCAIVSSEGVGWILLYMIDIAYVVITKSSAPPGKTTQEHRVSELEERAYASDILYWNNGKKVDVFLNFMKNGPNDRIFEGKILFAGVDFFMFEAVQMGGPLLCSWVNLAYVIFREPPNIPEGTESELPHEYFNVNYLDMFKENVHRKVTLFLNFGGNSLPEQRILAGECLVVGNDSVIVRRLGTIEPEPTLAFFTNIAYLIFNEELLIPKKAAQIPTRKRPSRTLQLKQSSNHTDI